MLVGWALALLVIGWGAAAAAQLLSADGHLRSGAATLEDLKHEVSLASITSDAPQPQLASAESAFGRAHAELASLWVAPLRILPWVGRQLASARDLAGAAAAITADGRSALSETEHLLEAPHSTAAERVSIIDEMARMAARLQNQLSGVHLGPRTGLIGALASKRATFASDLSKLRSGVKRAAGATAGLAAIVGGKHTYLVVADNNAEMRDGSGMFLQVGTLTIDEGHLQLGPFVPTPDLASNHPLAPLTGDLAARWGQERPNEEWRNLALSPQFPENASLAAEMWAAEEGQRVEGVIAVDVGFLADVLPATGPVAAGGLQVDASDVLTTLLEKQYVNLPANSRHEDLGELAAAVFQKLQAPGTSLARLAKGLDQAANGRHLLVWSSNPRVEADWSRAGVAGVVKGDELLLGVMNQGANKLDPYLRVSATLSLQPTGKDTEVTVKVTATDQAPSGLSPYVAGGVFYPPYDYVGTVALDFPQRAGYATVTGGPLVTAGPDGQADVLAASLHLSDGQSRTVIFHFTLAGRHGSLTVEPSARIPPDTWSYAGTTFSDATARTIDW